MVHSTQIQSKFAHVTGDPIPEFNSETPTHPALVHFPIAFNILAWSLDLLYAFTTLWLRPNFLTSRFGDEQTLLDISRLGYFLLCAGLITTIPAIISGNLQLVDMIKKAGGIWEMDTEGKQRSTMIPKIKVTITHAIVNDVIFVFNLYSWYLRRSTDAKLNIGNMPGTTNVAISAALLPFLISSAKAGGTLVYNHGVGLKLGRKKYV